MDPAAIEDLDADIAAGRYGLIDSFLLIRHGKIVADLNYTHDYHTIASQYDSANHQYNYDHPDWHPFYRGTELHSLQSATKSVTSVALGVADYEGYIKGVNVAAMSFFEDYKPDMSDPRRRAITLEDLLTMRSGIDWNSTPRRLLTSGLNSEDQMEASDEWVRFVLGRPMREEPGTRFDYNSGGTVLLGKIVGVATGQRVDEWASERLFKRIGITSYYWKETPDNEIDTEGGLYLSSYDFARIGYLFLRKGMWKDQRIVSEDWVKTSTSPIVNDVRPDNNEPNPGYGYQWWVPEHDGPNARIYSAQGYGGQYLMVMPAHDLVVAINGWNIHDEAELPSLRILETRIIPAINRE